MSNNILSIRSCKYDGEKVSYPLSFINNTSEYTIYRVVLCGYFETEMHYDFEKKEFEERTTFVNRSVDIYDPSVRELTLLNPVLTLEINSPGSFEFTILPDHKYYDGINTMGVLIEVYENDELIWFGRPIEIEKDFYKQKKIYCEGALGFLKDSVVPQFGYHKVEDPRGSDYGDIYEEEIYFNNLSEFIEFILSHHNKCITAYGSPMIFRNNYDQMFKSLNEFRNYIEYLITNPYGYYSQEIIEYYRNILNEIDNDNVHFFPSLNECPQINTSNFKFQLGYIDQIDKTINPQSDEGWFNSSSIIEDYLLNPLGGYVVITRKDGINYFNWYKDFPLDQDKITSNQPVEFGLNLLDISWKFSGTDYCTSVMPLGPKVNMLNEDSEDNTGVDQWLRTAESNHDILTHIDEGKYLTIQMINGGIFLPPEYLPSNYGPPYMDSEAVKTYGRIIHIKSFEDAKGQDELVEEGKKYLEDTQFNSLTIECTATDLHYQNGNFDKFYLGQVVHIKSVPHLIDRDFPISKLSINLDTAVKQITLGTVPRKELTKMQEVDKDKFKHSVVSSATFNGINKEEGKMYFVY